MQYTQSMHIHTQAHTNLYIHIRIDIPAYNIHSFTYRQYTTILAYTYTYRAAAYLTHLCTAAYACSHTVYVMHSHTYIKTHTYTQRLIIRVLYTQVCTRGADTIGILCRGADIVGITHSVACFVALYQRPPHKKHLTNTPSCVILNT